MKKWLMRLRGILGSGAIWGGFGAALGAVLGGVTGALVGGAILSWALDGALQLGGVGFAMGAGFAVMLVAFDGRRQLEELSPVRAALWGAFASLALPSLVWVLSGSAIPALTVAMAAGLGAGLGSGTVLIARTDRRNLPAGSMPTREPTP